MAPDEALHSSLGVRVDTVVPYPGDVKPDLWLIAGQSNAAGFAIMKKVTWGILSTAKIIGKFIISLTMFVGRLGPLTIAMAISETEKPRFKYAQEKLLIG